MTSVVDLHINARLSISSVVLSWSSAPSSKESSSSSGWSRPLADLTMSWRVRSSHLTTDLEKLAVVLPQCCSENVFSEPGLPLDFWLEDPLPLSVLYKLGFTLTILKACSNWEASKSVCEIIVVKKILPQQHIMQSHPLPCSSLLKVEVLEHQHNQSMHECGHWRATGEQNLIGRLCRVDWSSLHRMRKSDSWGGHCRSLWLSQSNHWRKNRPTLQSRLSRQNDAT